MRFRRFRNRILKHLAQRINDNNSDDLLLSVKRYCKIRGIQATDTDLQSVVSQAIQLRLAKRIKQLNAKIDGFHPPP